MEIYHQCIGYMAVTFVKIHIIVYLKSIHLTVCKFYLKKCINKKNIPTSKILNGERQSFFSKIRNKVRMPVFSTTPIQYSARVLARAVRQENKIKSIQIEKQKCN